MTHRCLTVDGTLYSAATTFSWVRVRVTRSQPIRRRPTRRASGLSVMLIAARPFHAAGIAIIDSEAVSRMASQLSRITGPSGFYIYSIGFWAAVLASLVGVWQTVPFIFADCWSLLRRPSQEGSSDANSSRVRSLALASMAVVSIPFAFVQRPLLRTTGCAGLLRSLITAPRQTSFSPPSCSSFWFSVQWEIGRLF